MKQAYIIDGVRTPIGNYKGTLSAIRTDDLGAHVIKALVSNNPQIPKEAFDDVIMGCANQAGEDNRNVARMSLLLAGLPFSVPGETVNRLCSSGLSAIIHANRAIKAGDGDVFIAGGVENMTRGPYVMAKPSSAYGGDSKMYDSTFGWRFVNPKMASLYGVDGMGVTAENLVAKYTISREDQDAFAYNSHMKALKAQAEDRFQDQIVPITVHQTFINEAGKKQSKSYVVNKDEGPREGTSIQALAKLRAVFAAGGSVTAGNSSQMSDGAAFVMVMSEEMVKELNLEPIARMANYAAAGVEPRIMGIGPVKAIPKALKQAGLKQEDIKLIELNEAFASQSLAVIRELDLNPDIINVNGGAIALGHPLGCTGAKLSVQLFDEMRKRDMAGQYGMITMCVGTGQGAAGIFEFLK